MSDAEKSEAGAAAATTSGNLLDEILAETKIKPSDDAYQIAKAGVQAFITQMLAPANAAERVDKARST